MPALVPVALASLTVPRVGATTLSEFTCTRIASYFSSCNKAPVGLASGLVRTTGPGRVFPVLIAKTLLGDVSSVCDGLLGSLLGMNSCTFPVMHRSLPTAAAAGGALEVKTKTPSDVLGSPSPG